MYKVPAVVRIFSLPGTHVLKGLVWYPGAKGGVGTLKDGAEREDTNYRSSSSQPFHGPAARRHG